MLMSRKILSLTIIATLLLTTIGAFSLPAQAETEYIINDTFDDGTAQGWTAATGFTAGYDPVLEPKEDEDGTKYLRMTANNLGSALATTPYIYRTVNDSAGIPFSADKNIVIEAKIRVDNRGPYTGVNPTSSLAEERANEPNDKADKRIHFKYNMPPTVSELSSLKVSTGAAYTGNATGHLSLFEMQYGFPRIGTGSPWTNVYTNGATSGTDYVGRAGYWSNKWFTFHIVLSGTDGKTMDFYCIDESGIQPSGAISNKTITYATQETALKNIVFSPYLGSGTSLNAGYPCTVDIDYVRVYETGTYGRSVKSLNLASQTYAVGEPIELKATRGILKLNDGAVRLESVDGGDVPADVTFEGDIISVKPQTDLTVGNYRAIVDGSKITFSPNTLATATNISSMTLDFPVVNTADAQSITDDFQDGNLNDWKLRNTADASYSLTVETEGDNKFARLSASNMAATGYYPLRIPTASKPVKISAGDAELTVVEAKIRTNEINNFNKYFKLSWPTSTGWLGRQIGANSTNKYTFTDNARMADVYYNLWSVKKTAENASNLTVDRGVSSYNDLPNSQVLASFEANKWYTMRTYIDYSTGKPVLSTVMLDEDGTVLGNYIRPENSTYVWYQDYFNPITSLDFAMFLSGTAGTEAQLDFDDVKVYTVPKNPSITYSVSGSDISANYKMYAAMGSYDLYLIHAVYDVTDGMSVLEDVQLVKKTLDIGSELDTSSDSITLPAGGNHIIKSFIWTDKLQPIAENSYPAE